MESVAEGVETMEQLGALKEMGCDQLQGYLVSKPLSRDEFAALLERGKGVPLASGLAGDLHRIGRESLSRNACGGATGTSGVR
jgi:predicted signal transduction protein with EAL and GGDEF domain